MAQIAIFSEDPDNSNSGAQRFSSLHGVEYETYAYSDSGSARTRNIPCAVCYAPSRAGIPARRSVE